MTNEPSELDRRLGILFLSTLSLFGATAAIAALDYLALMTAGAIARMPTEAANIQRDSALAAVLLGAIFTSMTTAPAAIQALGGTSVYRAPWPFGSTRSGGRSMAVSFGIAFALTATGDFTSGMFERLIGSAAFGYDAYARVAVFCFGLLASATFLAMSSMSLDTGAVPGGGFTLRRPRPARHWLWLVVSLIVAMSAPGFLLAAMAYLPVHIGTALASATAAGGAFPFVVPFSWVGTLLGFGPGHACAAGVATCLLLAWGTCNLAAHSHRDAVMDMESEAAKAA